MNEQSTGALTGTEHTIINVAPTTQAESTTSRTATTKADKTASSAETTTGVVQQPVRAAEIAQKVMHSQWTVLFLLAVVAILTCIVCRLRKHNKKLTYQNAADDETKSDNIMNDDVSTVKTVEPPLEVKKDEPAFQIARVHNIGKRKGQQDSFGVSDITNKELCGRKGILAVVADGMGGLKGGDEVSSNIVLQFLQKFSVMSASQSAENELTRILDETVESINNKLISENALKKSGSTLISVIVRNKTLSWVSVGDSRIALYRNGKITDLNQKHIYAVELEEQVRQKLITPQEAANNPEKDKLTSYIGMGSLKYVDKSVRPMPLISGDKIILMTDGIFNTLSDAKIEALLQLPTDKIGFAIEKEVLSAGNPYQDNFTAVVLEIP